MRNPKPTTARVIGALMLREMITRYGRSPAGYLWAVLEPAAFVAILSLIFSQVAHQPPVGRSFPLFYATGYVAFHWFHDISSVTARSVHVNRALFAFPAVRPLDALVARFALQALTGVVVAALIFGTILAVFADQVRVDPAPLIAAWGLAAVLGLGVGLVNCWLFALSKSWEVVWGIVSRPLFLVSCVFFTFETLPAFARDLLWWNPLVHVVGLVRKGFYPVYDGAHVTPEYVAAVALGLCLLGLAALRLVPGRIVSP